MSMSMVSRQWLGAFQNNLLRAVKRGGGSVETLLREELDGVHSRALVQAYAIRIDEQESGNMFGGEDEKEGESFVRTTVFSHPMFTADLLAWRPHGSSLVHDHQASSCWVKVLKGNLVETRYNVPARDRSHEQSPPLSVLKGSRVEYEAGCVSYMNGRLGIHKMQNPSGVKAAHSLHVYAPPLSARHIFDDNGGLLELDRPMHGGAERSFHVQQQTQMH
eukprot:CAMPEP_0185848352 /NCGR_PEP_ID=MMETSP1354-20130828/3270_1 /TAXON_ID=708628 /ORGANISM="Erythrolobus madagascarensis, Strain CCMP3276" /LENGTH=218 /DNA_ID=CAMNT_0028548743 /DNA_START=118 /DNA_END=774 /DNA_ORIENTATION=+